MSLVRSRHRGLVRFSSWAVNSFQAESSRKNRWRLNRSRSTGTRPAPFVRDPSLRSVRKSRAAFCRAPLAPVDSFFLRTPTPIVGSVGERKTADGCFVPGQPERARSVVRDLLLRTYVRRAAWSTLAYGPAAVDHLISPSNGDHAAHLLPAIESLFAPFGEGPAADG